MKTTPMMLLTRKVATTADPIIDDEGRCPCHPFVQLSRRSSRTGEWMSLLDSCPLCVTDSKSTPGDVNKEGGENPLVHTAAAPGARLRGRKPRQLSSSLPQRRSSSGSSCGSRVRFHPDQDVQFSAADNASILKCKESDKDVQFTTTNAVNRGKPALRASPRYKVCEELMQQQLDESVKVPTMSMDMSMDFSTHDDEGSRSSFNHSHDELKHDKQKEQHEEDNEQQQVEDVKEDEKLLPSLPPLSSPHRNEDDIIETSTRRMHDDKEIESTDVSQRRQEWDDGNKSGSRGRRSYQQVKAVPHRPDPEEFLRDDISGCGSQTSNQDYRMQKQSYPSQLQSSSSQRQRGRREVEVGGHQPRSRSTSLSFSNHHQREHQSQRPQHNASSALATPQVENSMRSLHASPGSATRHNHHHTHRQQQPLYTNTVFPVPNDDEVYAMTFMGHFVRSSLSSVSPNIHRASMYENSSQEQGEGGTSSSAAKVTDKAVPVSVLSLSTMMVDTNEFDPKTGRCIHHPHVRLRKKKLFGKGWKVLMSACPDCCVGELRRIRLAEENSLKLSVEREEKIERFSHRVSELTDESDYDDNRSSVCNRGSINRGRSDEGGTSASTRRSRSFSRSSIYSPKSKMTSSSATKVEPLPPPPPPPRRSSSHDIRRGTLPLPRKKEKQHTQHESDETTASLTCSDGSSSSNHSKTKKEKDDVSKANIGDASNHQELEEEERYQVQKENHRTIHVRQMRWSDPKNGQSGTYTGQVNHYFVPHGCGAMEYDPNPDNDMSGLGVSVVLVKDGEWKDGRFGRHRHRSRSRGNTINEDSNCDGRSVRRSSYGSIRFVGSEESGENRLSSSSTRSRSRDIIGDEKHRRSCSSQDTSQSQHRRRSSSRSAKQVSF